MGFCTEDDVSHLGQHSDLAWSGSGKARQDSDSTGATHRLPGIPALPSLAQPHYHQALFSSSSLHFSLLFSLASDLLLVETVLSSYSKSVTFFLCL